MSPEQQASSNALGRRSVVGWLFVGVLSLAILLVLLVVLAPLVDSPESPSNGWRRVVALLARDAVLRRTCLISAVGLVVTACVFFRRGRRGISGGWTPPPRNSQSSRVAGA
jgi:hypothetical protein